MVAPLIHKSLHSVGIGQTTRLEIEYSPCCSAEEYLSLPPPSLWLRVRNTEPLALRAAYVAGPYSLYVDCRPESYSVSKKTFVTADQPVFEPQLHPGQTFCTELSCHTYNSKYKWLVDVSSQMLFSLTQTVNFEVCVSSGREIDETIAVKSDPRLLVGVHDTLDLWNLPLPDPAKPTHLVILTHGLHSNVSADMLFLKEMIDASSENVVVKGYFGNACKTERGIKYLGSRVAEYVIGLLKNESLQNTTKISFVGHSLGGLVQTFAIAYLETNYPWFFQQLQPVNFITLASPMLGVVHENPAYVKIALQAGVAGRTGHDLGLQFTEQDNKPLLLLLPSGPTHRILKRFVRRTAYANVFNDGIVPLRTSALLYLDYKGLSTILGTAKPELLSSAKIPRDLPDASKDSSTLPFLAMLSYFMPQKQRSIGRSEEQSATTEEHALGDPLGKIHKPSVLESATSIFLPPLPPMKYITDPESRQNVILHDRVYTEKDLPPLPGKLKRTIKRRTSEGEKVGMMQKISTKSEEIKQLLLGSMTEHYEEEIAREYHKQMLWRKVLVNLMPDAHNNIVVRRRFANAFGWPVVEHLVSNHFGVEEIDGLDITNEDSFDLGADGAELTKILSMDVIKRENEELDRNSVLDKEHSWIKITEHSEAFDGPAGVFQGFSERMLQLKQEWQTNGLKVFGGKTDENDVEPVNSKYRVMDTFL
ncbi:DUF676-domain-containing protein [Metschnikowia bicuspidata var. bicuspidata NRRL YB-4993]|uniref:DUF676-domain-containing protein n=1 Tax=Metschnikowia bicuspidata var. bicuspidata NRRL YB-4993 TaxID=869754 RepID=A0A1A0H5L1_9ASCO|nr:DUF676-domain-containing protein [Metschnikowia bicuspidata var. bicuspidata NRRL YB-4993]OBA19331.1 DUF676-domain-containing protein [Metschnikowia bicuspidata var. bicuspidata NRRL YB-4993]